MAFDPVAVADEIRRSYAMNLIGIHPRAMNTLLARLGEAGASIDEKLSDLVRMKGPYLQALGIPQWGVSDWRSFGSGLRTPWTPYGLVPEIIETFHELGFKRLYRFQEEGIQAVLDDSHTLVVAGTGRGKTESWLLPILQYIIACKRNEIQDSVAVNGTKALLLYPTKALAQDQLKRLLHYLFRLNAKLEPAARISVGIFDGDTPYRSEASKQTYLVEAFQYFRCPIFDPNAAKCKTCGQHLAVVFDELHPERLNLAVPRAECRPLADLSFVRLVREDVIETCPDIVLTNPDMLNLRLLNVNGADERRFLIEQPKFIVLDELHTYTGLFGSFTAFILRRLKQQRAAIRQQRGDVSPDSLRFIAASATIENDRDLFMRLCDLDGRHIAVIKEQTVSLVAPAEMEIPEVLHGTALVDEDLNNALISLASGEGVPSPYAQVLQLFGDELFNLPPINQGEDAVLDAAAEQMFTALTSPPQFTPGLDILRLLHHQLTQHPMTPDELKREVQSQFPALTLAEIQRLGANFALLGARSGLLENRVHLFAWPVDGFYVCPQCGHVYSTPQGNCTFCGWNFVTKVTLCNKCGEEALESWFCPHCQRLFPLHATVEGEVVYWKGYTCNCTGADKPTLRVIWKPWYRCLSCESIQRLSSNVLSGDHPAACKECGGNLEPIMRLPWICRNCGQATFGDTAPPKCSCGSYTFALGALVDVPQALHCEQCKGDFIPGLPHDPTHVLRPMGAFSEYKVLSSTWQVRKPVDFRHSVPCYHPHVPYNKQRRYESLMRSPANTAVTSAQFALRYVAREAEGAGWGKRLRQVKMLSFSDSYSDMEQLAQDFDDPERNTFIDQAIVAELEQGSQTLKDLQVRVFERLRSYGDLTHPMDNALQSYDWIKHFEDTRVYDEVTSRFVSGHYMGLRTQSSWLIREGIANIRLMERRLSESERMILESLARMNNQTRARLRSSLIVSVPDFDEVLEHLRERNLIEVSTVQRREFVTLNPEKLVCSLVSVSQPIRFSRRRGRYVSDLERALSGEEFEDDVIEDDDIEDGFADDVKMGLRYDQRIDPGSPRFAYSAYRIAYTPPLLLRSEVYKGDIDKRDRRRIEHSFKSGADTHFLSTGPAMEVGIDIGDLNLLLLYGTPPNINSYLQRIGRAGRRAKRSLVMTVSKRNPIDYFYYRYPLDLITSDAQPVPLNEYNEETLRISLTWALLDFIATNYWVPWRRERRPEGTFYTDGQDFFSTLEAQPQDILRLLMMVFSIDSVDLEYGLPLKALSCIVHDRQDEARAYLRHLLDQRICSACGSRWNSGVEHCRDPQCDGLPVLLAQRYGHLIEEALEQFAARMVDYITDFRKELKHKRRDLEHRRDDIEDELETLPRGATDLRRKKLSDLARLDGHLRAIDDVKQQLDRAKLVEAQSYTAQQRYAYQIRQGEDTVEIVKFDVDSKTKAIHAVSRPSRGMRMALKEYHPYAVILSGRQLVFTRRVEFNDYKTAELRTRLEDTPLHKMPLVCPGCGATYDAAPSGTCACGANLVRMELHVLRRAEVQPLKMSIMDDPDMSGSGLYPREVFRGVGRETQVARTYAEISSEVVSFKPHQQLDILDAQNRSVGTLAFGDVEIITFSDGCTVTYKDGGRSPWVQRFMLCGEEGCNGVIVQGRDVQFCALDPHHDVNKRRIVRLGYLFNTQGLRLQLHYEPWAVTHALAHGFRVALEKIGGLSVRNINELLHEREREVYIYDATPGGSGVCELLVKTQGGDYHNFTTALEVIEALVSNCDCADGCPHCLYQYGCHNWNQPTTLSRHSLWAFMLKGLSLRSREGAVGDDKPPAPAPVTVVAPASSAPLIWSSEEETLRQQTWRLICDLEHQLRRLIEARYQSQFGELWLERVPESMRLQWEQVQEQDVRAFQKYTHTASSLLDYSYLGELMVLITSQWQLFLDVFGQGKPAKRELQDKLEAIIKVRNPLAHNRAAPENELKRAEVFCTDILMLVQSGPLGEER